MTIALGFVLLGLSIALIKIAKSRELAGSKFWTMAARSTWLPILFTAMFGLGFVSLIGGVIKLVGA